MPTLLLSSLMVLRLLMPPGICVCKLSSPVLRLLAVVQDKALPPEPVQEDDDDHNPGCPASFLSVGMGVAPPSGPGPLDLQRTGWLIAHTVPLPASSTDLLSPPYDIPIPEAPLYVTQCALIV
jgi:hypothetical protein